MTVVTKLSLIQLFFTLIFFVAAYIFGGKLHGISALLGGSICTTANLFFAGKLFLAKQAEDPKIILRQFYRSEALKIAFTIAMFILVIKLVHLEFLSFILAYSFAALLNWLCLPFLK